MWAVLARTPDGLAPLFRGMRWPLAIGFVALGLATGPLLVILLPFTRATSAPIAELLQQVHLGGAAWIPFALYYSFTHPGVEEGYWRGVVAGRMRSPWWSDVAYGGYHALVLVRFVHPAAAIVTAGMLAGAGLVWRRVARATGGLAVPFLCHLAADASFIGALLWLVRTGG